MKRQSVRIVVCILAMAVLCLLPFYAQAAGKRMSLRWQDGRRTVAAGKKITLKVKIRHKKRGAKLVWNSSDKKTAVVSKKGVVLGKKPGKARITVKIRGTRIKRTCTVRVTKKITGESTSSPGRSTVPAGDRGTGPSLPEKPEEGMASAVPTAKPTEEPAASPTGEPGTPPTGDPVGSPTGKPFTPTPTESATPTVTYVPADMELIPYSAVMKIDGETMTVFLVNKNYSGQIHFIFQGREFDLSGDAKDALMMLAYGGTTKTDSTGTIQISRQKMEDGTLAEYWTVEDQAGGQSYQIKAATKNTVNPAIANCGVIYVRGDVTSVFCITA